MADTARYDNPAVTALMSVANPARGSKRMHAAFTERAINENPFGDVPATNPVVGGSRAVGHKRKKAHGAVQRRKTTMARRRKRRDNPKRKKHLYGPPSKLKVGAPRRRKRAKGAARRPSWRTAAQIAGAKRAAAKRRATRAWTQRELAYEYAENPRKRRRRAKRRDNPLKIRYRKVAGKRRAYVVKKGKVYLRTRKKAPAYQKYMKAVTKASYRDNPKRRKRRSNPKRARRHLTQQALGRIATRYHLIRRDNPIMDTAWTILAGGGGFFATRLAANLLKKFVPASTAEAQAEGFGGIMQTAAPFLPTLASVAILAGAWFGTKTVFKQYRTAIVIGAGLGVLDKLLDLAAAKNVPGAEYLLGTGLGQDIYETALTSGYGAGAYLPEGITADDMGTGAYLPEGAGIDVTEAQAGYTGTYIPEVAGQDEDEEEVGIDVTEAQAGYTGTYIPEVAGQDEDEEEVGIDVTEAQAGFAGPIVGYKKFAGRIIPVRAKPAGLRQKIAVGPKVVKAVTQEPGGVFKESVFGGGY